AFSVASSRLVDAASFFLRRSRSASTFFTLTLPPALAGFGLLFLANWSEPARMVVRSSSAISPRKLITLQQLFGPRRRSAAAPPARERASAGGSGRSRTGEPRRRSG